MLETNAAENNVIIEANLAPIVYSPTAVDDVYLEINSLSDILNIHTNSTENNIGILHFNACNK